MKRPKFGTGCDCSVWCLPKRSRPERWGRRRVKGTTLALSVVLIRPFLAGGGLAASLLCAQDSFTRTFWLLCPSVVSFEPQGTLSG